MITKAKKRLLTFTMVLMVYVVAVLSPVSVSQMRVMAAECEGDYEYIYLPDNSVEITSYNGTDAQVVLPDNISGRTISVIGENAFCENKTLETVVIPESVTAIQKQAFASCENLKNVYIYSESKLKTIGEACFWMDKKLEKITFPKSLRNIDKNAFGFCAALTEVKFNDGFQSIGEYAFCSSGIKSVDIKDSITNVGTGAFCDCEELLNVSIGKGISAIYDYTFTYCDKLDKVVIPDNVKSIGKNAFDKNTQKIVLKECNVIGYSVSLSDKIDLKMYTYVSNNIRKDAGVKVNLTLPDGTGKDILLSKCQTVNYNGVNTFLISADLVPAYITGTVTMKITGSDGKVKGSFTSSVYDYAKDYIKRSNYDDTYKCGLNLVKAMLDYGAAAQTYFGINTDKPANKDQSTGKLLTDNKAQITDSSGLSEKIQDKTSGKLQNTDLTYEYMSLLCKSRTGLKLYFENKNSLTLDQIKGKYSINIYDSKGKKLPAAQYELKVDGKEFTIKINNILPVQLSSYYTVELVGGGSTAKGTVSPSVYMKKAMGVGGENLKKLCNAMYFYNNEAVVYSKSK